MNKILNPERLAQAAREQKKASDPSFSVFVSASAGSGKTKILVDRILRLMLPSTLKTEDGLVRIEPTPPERILCLTYTKAAAAEMMERLRRELASWFQLSDQALEGKLQSLGMSTTSDVLHDARSLLGKVLEAPGGMKIQTIHSFCQSLLQRFPAESGLVPNFELIDDLTQDEHLQNAFDDALATCSRDDFRMLVDHYEPSSITENIFKLCKAASSKAEFQGTLDDIDINVIASSFRGIDFYQQARTEAFYDTVRNGFNKIIQDIGLVEKATSALENLFIQIREGKRVFDIDPKADWTGAFLTKALKPAAAKTITEKVVEQSPRLRETFDELALLAQTAKQAIRFEESLPFLSLFATLTLKTLKRSNELKSAFQHVTYGDLLLRTKELLEGVEEAWVRYKLDGGIDHILLDEVQDNSRLQWEIVHALTDEFFENTTEANKKPRTIFAVGDFKQSIYGFQGAEPDEFFKEKSLLQKKAEDAHCYYVAPELRFSFRTHQPLLDFVNQVFKGEDEALGMENFIDHESVKSARSGRVEIWPTITPQKGEDTEEQEEDGDGEDTPAFLTAVKIANFIARQLNNPPKWLSGQSLLPKDIMVLTRKRGNPDFLALLESLLKRQGVPTVNGARFDFKKHIAVQDLMALCRVLLLPADDLSLAKVLLSPLGGLSHVSLMELILENGKPSKLNSTSFEAETLWDLLARRATEPGHNDWLLAHKTLTELWNKTDYESPYSLLSRALGQYGGYDRYCARFGKEVFEILDAFLNFALDFEANNVSSLEGFINWLETENLELKREDLKTSNAVQLMTVHAAKGLESKMVILADIPGDANKDKEVWVDTLDGPSLPTVLSLVKDSDAVQKKAKEADFKEQSELDRLLYVALTRSSEWFVCASWNKKTEDATIRWNERCRDALKTLQENGDKRVLSEMGEEGEKVVLNGENFDSGVENDIHETGKEEHHFPQWFRNAEEVLKPEKSSEHPLRPSRPEGAEFGPKPFSFSPITPKDSEGISPRERGVLVHKLLQLLPDVDPGKRSSFAEQWSNRNMNLVPENERKQIIENCLAVLEKADIAPLFSNQASVEQPVSGLVNGMVALGKIDRVFITDEDIWLGDYKTGRPPARGRDILSTYIRQMQIYAKILRDIKPHAKLHAFLIWTQNAEVMDITSRILN